MSDSREIVLASIAAGFIHPAFGLRYLLANLEPDLAARARLEEFSTRMPMAHRMERLHRAKPRILALSVHIWSHVPTRELLEQVRRELPETLIVLGGPEVSHLPEDHPLLLSAHGIIRSEADLVFSSLCRSLLESPREAPPGARWLKSGPDGGQTWVLDAPKPDLSLVQGPYHLYSDFDLERRLVYVEASRGCPFACEFCLSSLERKVRTFPLAPFLDEMDELHRRGGQRFKFIDRTFNLDMDRTAAILEFWIRRLKEGQFVQFEIVPDRLPAEMRRLLQQFRPGTLRLEVGIQTYDPETAARISRRQDYSLSRDNLAFLSRQTPAVIHADLIVGLPGEGLESFGQGFDELWSQRPGEIQVGILKKLPGAPIARHDQSSAMVYSPEPPYEVLSTGALPAADLDRLKHFAKYWELYVNRGRFPDLIPRLLPENGESAFERFLAFSDWAYERLGRTWGLDLKDQKAALEDYLAP